MVSIAVLDPDGVSGGIVDQLVASGLSSLHWRLANEPLKSINLLKLELVDVGQMPHRSKKRADIVEQSDQYCHNLIIESRNNELPYLYLFFLKERDIDEYKLKIRPKIRALIEDGVENLIIPIEWMVVVVGEEVKKNSVLNNTNLLAKLKSDFGHNDENSCLRIRTNSKENPEFNQDYAILVSVLKEKLLRSFSSRVELYKSQLQLLASKPIQNPLFTLILRNHILKIYYDMTLYEDALQECDLLTASFSRFIADKSLNLPINVENLNLSSFIGNPLFDADSVDLDTLILKQELNIIQFYCYSLTFQSKCLYLLAKSDTALTFSTIHIVELLKRVNTTIITISALWKDQGSIPLTLFEFYYIMIEEFLNDDYIIAEIEQNFQNLETGNTSDIMELVGELKMSQKKHYLELGKLFHYKIPGKTEDISLDETETTETFKPSYLPLQKFLSSEESFVDEYISMTKSIIEGFNLADIRPRTIDILSTEIALVAHSRENYEEAIEILKDSFRYYDEQGWDYLGSFLLKIYIECLEKTNTDDLNALLNSYVDLLSTKTCTKEEATKVSKKVEDLSDKIQMNFLLEYLFEPSFDSKLSPHGVNKFALVLTLKSKVKAPFKIDKIEMDLVDKNENSIKFQYEESVYFSGIESFPLISNDLINRLVAPRTLKLHSGKLTFTHVITNIILPPVSSIIPGNFSAKLSVPRNRKLNENSLTLAIRNGDSSIKDMTIHFPKDPNLSFLETVVCTSTKSGQIKVILKNDADFKIQVPNDVDVGEVLELKIFFESAWKPQEQKVLNVKYSISFTQDNETHKYISTDQIDPALSIAVVVQDIFESSIFYPNFSIGSSDGKYPIRIMDVNLTLPEESSSHYNIESPSKIPKNITAFGGQPVKCFYKIQRLNSQVGDDKFYLIINYRDLKDECLMVVESELQKTFESQYEHIKPLLRKSLEFNLTLYSLTNRIKTTHVDYTAFSQSKEELSSLKAFFEEFENGKGFKCENYDFTISNRSLKLEVPMPLIPVIHEVGFDYQRLPNYVVGTPIDITMFVKTTTSWSGELPLEEPVEEREPLKIPSLAPPSAAPSRPNSPGLESTSSFVNGDGQYWQRSAMSSTSTIDLNLESNKSKKKKKFVKFESRSDDKLRSFQVELQLADSWLLSGNRSFTFNIKANGTHEFELDPVKMVLIPLKLGRISLPKIEIKPIVNGEVLNEAREMEINYKNRSEALVVVSDIDKISIDL